VEKHTERIMKLSDAIWAKLLQQSDQQLRSATISAEGQHLVLIGFRPRTKTTAYAIALDVNGNLEWKKRFRIGPEGTIGLAGAAVTDGGFAVAGQFATTGKGFIMKIDSGPDAPFSATPKQPSKNLGS
jgi:hypothetical protein